MRITIATLCVLAGLSGCGLTGDPPETAERPCTGSITANSTDPCFNQLLAASGTAVCGGLVAEASPQFIREQRRFEQPTIEDQDGEPLPVVESEPIEIRDGEVVTPVREVETQLEDNVFVAITNDRCRTPIRVKQGEVELGFGVNTLFVTADAPGVNDVTMLDSGEPLMRVTTK